MRVLLQGLALFVDVSPSRSPQLISSFLSLLHLALTSPERHLLLLTPCLGCLTTVITMLLTLCQLVIEQSRTTNSGRGALTVPQLFGAQCAASQATTQRRLRTDQSSVLKGLQSTISSAVCERPVYLQGLSQCFGTMETDRQVRQSATSYIRGA